LDELFDEINSMQKSDFGTKAFTDYEDRFQYFLFAALVFLLIEFFLSERKSKLARRLNIFESKSKKA
jgi:Ca-activated chloride channel family protein